MYNPKKSANILRIIFFVLFILIILNCLNNIFVLPTPFIHTRTILLIIQYFSKPFQTSKNRLQVLLHPKTGVLVCMYGFLSLFYKFPCIIHTRCEGCQTIAKSDLGYQLETADIWSFIHPSLKQNKTKFCAANNLFTL